MSKEYKLLFDKRFFKELEKIPKKFRKTIDAKILGLSKCPRPEGSIKLKGSKDQEYYRIRSGDYRIIYQIKDEVLIVILVEVGHRKEVYSDF